MKRGTLVVMIIFVILTSGSLAIYGQYSRDGKIEQQDSVIAGATGFDPLDTTLPSEQNELVGTLDPVVIEQTGNKTTATIHAETDSKTNVKTNLSIDTANNWVGTKASVNLWNLKRLYVENGSLSDGINGVTANPTGSVTSGYPYGWDAFSYTPDPGVDMFAGYSLDTQDVYVQANGKRVGQNYFYADGSYVYWAQTINNTPYLENFILNLDYIYTRGPEGNPNLTLFVSIDEAVIWNATTETISVDVPYNTGDILVNLTGIGSQFDFKIGLNFNGNVTYQFQWIEFYLDNIQFNGETDPYFDDANISLNIGIDSATITGLDSGFVFITNPSFWKTQNVLIELTSPLSYSFDYYATMASSRFINSTRAIESIPHEGVHFTSQVNGNPLLEFYTFIGAIPDIDDFTLIIRTPNDWENASVFNPYGTTVTSSCEITSGSIIIPNSILYTLGWWEVHMEVPNYVRNLQTLKFEESSLTWVSDTVFRSTNITMPTIEIGGAMPLPSALQDVNITWLMPDATEWFSETISGGINGEINGSQLEFGPTNTTAGLWQVVVSWTNGTELAFGSTIFEVHHGATLSSSQSVIETQSGVSVSNFVYYRDSENDQLLTSPDASITANWSMTTINFVPDPIQNRWIGTFDTSMVGPGTHLVVVNASRPFFDDASCTFFVTISFTDNELSIDNPTAEIGIGDTFIATFSYSDHIGIGIPGANVSIDITGTIGGITYEEPVDLGDGDYSIEFTAVHSDRYVITISASKPFYDESQDAMFILVGEKTTSISLENGTSSVISYGEDYRLVVRYTNGTGFGLDGASVSVLSTTPETGINYTTFADEGSGYYSILLTPDNTGTFTLLINASILDHKTQLISFTLTATTIATQLRVADGSRSASIGVSVPFEIMVFYERYSGVKANISEATISITFTSLNALSPEIIHLTDGYLIQFPTNQMGRYEFTIVANKTGYQNGAVDFTLYIRERAMRIEMQTPVWEQTRDLNITLRLLEVDTESPVSEAVVSYRLYRFGGVEMEGYVNETLSGVYSIAIRPNWYDGTGYVLRIFAEIDNYALDKEYEFEVIQRTPPDVLLTIFLQIYLPPIIAIVAISIVSMSGRIIYKRKKRAEFALDLINQRRFDDADNIIGVIVMHKRSGIPIYSKIVKGGFEEGIVAAFIAAVTHFREEFEILEEESMKVIPISDIIRAVQTSNLICAFVTVRSASIEHNRKMEMYGMQVGTYLDDFYTESTPMSSTDDRIDEILDYVFDEIMDGYLLKFHKLATSTKIPKRYESIEKVMLDLESAHCSKPIYLAKAVTKYGVTEARGCTLISEAIQKGFLTPCEKHEIPEIEIDLAAFLDK
ncbi:MAG: hypothetical protein ACFFCX_11390 [Candidatus Sifarchaeia archaeon]